MLQRILSVDVGRVGPGGVALSPTTPWFIFKGVKMALTERMTGKTLSPTITNDEDTSTKMPVDTWAWASMVSTGAATYYLYGLLEDPDDGGTVFAVADSGGNSLSVTTVANKIMPLPDEVKGLRFLVLKSSDTSSTVKVLRKG